MIKKASVSTLGLRRPTWASVVVAVTYSALLAALATLQIWGRDAPMALSPMFGFLIVWTIILSRSVVRLGSGTMNLTALGTQSAAVLLDPLAAGTVGLTTGLLAIRRGRPASVLQVLGCALMPMIASTVRTALFPGRPPFAGVVLTITLNIAANVAITSTNIATIEGEAMISVWRRNPPLLFWASFGYFGFATLLLVRVLDGTWLGYFYASIVFILSLALTDTISGRRTRSLLEDQLSVADRHLLFSRAVEGVVHNVRNDLAAVAGAMHEIDPSELSERQRANLDLARDAADNAIATIRDMSAGATPRVHFAAEPVEAGTLVDQAVALARAPAKQANVTLQVILAGGPMSIRADPAMMRSVLSNLILNGIDASNSGGTVHIEVSARANTVRVTVRDDGSGVSPETQRRLFEPHFSTKPTGTGMGLFTSYGIVREHGGDLRFDGNTPGAAFVIELPMAES